MFTKKSQRPDGRIQSSVRLRSREHYGLRIICSLEQRSIQDLLDEIVSSHIAQFTALYESVHGCRKRLPDDENGNPIRLDFAISVDENIERLASESERAAIAAGC